MNTEERQLAEMLHRVTPEPPRGVTVEDVAFRLASEPGRKPRPGRGSLWNGVFRGGHGWTPVLAALSVFAIAGASAGIATVATSHHSRARHRATDAGNRVDVKLASLIAPSVSPASRSAAAVPVDAVPSHQPPAVQPGSLTGSGRERADHGSPALHPATGCLQTTLTAR